MPTDALLRRRYGARYLARWEFGTMGSGCWNGWAAAPAWRRRMAAGALAGAAWCATLAVHADPLYKCMQADGVPSFQSGACGRSSREVWVREVMAEASPPPPAPPAARPLPPAPRRFARKPPAHGARATAACAAARDAAADERERRWREISMDDLRRLDARVERACLRH